MTSGNNLLHLTSLFKSRRSLSLQRIMAECAVTRRTAFRYLGQLAEAGLHIKFDPITRKYCLNQSKEAIFAHATENDLLLLLCGLAFLKCHTNVSYSEQFEKIMRTIAVELSDAPSNFLHSILDKFEQCKNGQANEIETLSSILITFAIVNNMPVEIELPTSAIETDQGERHRIQNPALHFQGEWHLVAQESRERPIPLSEIKLVSLHAGSK